MEDIFSELQQNEAINYEPLLCVGLCNKCVHIKMQNQGNGIDEPLDPIPICIKKDFEVMPVPVAEAVKECEFFEPYT